MDEQQCTSCGASLPRTGTYCLACDTPVPEAVRGLSVGEIQVVQTGRPVVAIAVIGAAVAVVGLLGYGGLHLYQSHLDKNVSAAAIKSVQIVVRSEDGHDGGCPYVSASIAGDADTERTACIALAGDDPGAEVKDLHAVSVQRHGSTGSVQLRGTLVDKVGRRPFSTKVSMVKQDKVWMMQWNGSAIAAR